MGSKAHPALFFTLICSLSFNTGVHHIKKKKKKKALNYFQYLSASLPCLWLSALSPFVPVEDGNLKNDSHFLANLSRTEVRNAFIGDYFPWHIITHVVCSVLMAAGWCRLA